HRPNGTAPAQSITYDGPTSAAVSGGYGTAGRHACSWAPAATQRPRGRGCPSMSSRTIAYGLPHRLTGLVAPGASTSVPLRSCNWSSGSTASISPTTSGSPIGEPYRTLSIQTRLTGSVGWVGSTSSRDHGQRPYWIRSS